MKKDNDNEERLIETIVTIGTLIFFGLLSMYAMRGCSSEVVYTGDVTPETAIVSTVTATTVATNMEADVSSTSTTAPQELISDINGSAELEEELNTTTNADNSDLNATANEDENSDDNATIGADVPEKDSVENLANDENKDIEVDSNITVDTDKALVKDIADNTVKNVPKNSTSEANEEAGILADIKSASISAKPYVLKGIFFRSGSSILTKKSKRQLDAIAKALKEHKDVKVTIRGHTDSKGSKKANKRLSFKRATSTGIALVDRGVNIDNIWIDGMGETELITKNGTEKEMLLNRRVDIAVTK